MEGGHLNAPMTCPKCGQLDAVQAVSTIIDGGTTYTSGVAYSYATPSDHGFVPPTLYKSQSLSGLAHRLSPPGPPVPHFWRYFLWTFALGTILVILITLINTIVQDAGYSEQNPYSEREVHLSWIVYIVSPIAWWMLYLVPLMIVSTIVGFIFRARDKRRMIEAAEEWRARARRIYGAYYCTRDDTMFDQTAYGNPEGFIGVTFSS
jgi:hypothetical protein